MYVGCDLGFWQMVMRYPALLGLSIDNNLRPKLHYLVDEVKIEQQVIRQQVTSEREGEGESGVRREGGREEAVGMGYGWDVLCNTCTRDPRS